MKGKIKIAIDGYSSCGKSTLAKRLAKALNYTYIDSGAMYRAVTLFALEKGMISGGNLNEEALVGALDNIEVDFVNVDGINTTRLNHVAVEKEIRSMEVSSMVSQVSKIPEVRKKLREMQRKAASKGGVVMDGRDIGSAVLPDAELKIFMTADPKVRVERRFRELISKGISISREEVEANLRLRDKLDTEREENPLTRTSDARLLDNTDLSESQQFEKALNWVKELTAV